MSQLIQWSMFRFQPSARRIDFQLRVVVVRCIAIVCHRQQSTLQALLNINLALFLFLRSLSSPRFWIMFRLLFCFASFGITLRSSTQVKLEGPGKGTTEMRMVTSAKRREIVRRNFARLLSEATPREEPSSRKRASWRHEGARIFSSPPPPPSSHPSRKRKCDLPFGKETRKDFYDSLSDAIWTVNWYALPFDSPFFRIAGRGSRRIPV